MHYISSLKKKKKIQCKHHSNCSFLSHQTESLRNKQFILSVRFHWPDCVSLPCLVISACLLPHYSSRMARLSPRSPSACDGWMRGQHSITVIATVSCLTQLYQENEQCYEKQAFVVSSLIHLKLDVPIVLQLWGTVCLYCVWPSKGQSWGAGMFGGWEYYTLWQLAVAKSDEFPFVHPSN